MTIITTTQATELTASKTSAQSLLVCAIRTSLDARRSQQAGYNALAAEIEASTILTREQKLELFATRVVEVWIEVGESSQAAEHFASTVSVQTKRAVKRVFGIDPTVSTTYQCSAEKARTNAKGLKFQPQWVFTPPNWESPWVIGLSIGEKIAVDNSMDDEKEIDVDELTAKENAIDTAEVMKQADEMQQQIEQHEAMMTAARASVAAELEDMRHCMAVAESRERQLEDQLRDLIMQVESAKSLKEAKAAAESAAAAATFRHATA